MQNHLTINLWARDSYEVIVDKAEGRINYRLIEIECLSRILTEINANNGFQWFSQALLHFILKRQRCTYPAALGKFAVSHARTRF